jgi:hypothetical protein
VTTEFLKPSRGELRIATEDEWTMRKRTSWGTESSGISLWGPRVRIRIAEAELFGSLARCQLLSTDLDEGRHGGGIDAETLSYEVIVSAQLLQTKSDPIGRR